MPRYIWDKEAKDKTGNPWVEDHEWSVPESVYCPATGYYDPELRRRFESKTEKRVFLKQHHLKEDYGSGLPGGNPWKGMAESRERGQKVFIHG